jgi:hypothetical protein
MVSEERKQTNRAASRTALAVDEDVTFLNEGKLLDNNVEV